MRRLFGGVALEVAPGMWACDKKGPIVDVVLNGDYPEEDLRRMSLGEVEHLVMRLVEVTSRSLSRPKWWPSGLVFTHPIDLTQHSEGEIKLTFKRLVEGCSRFFRKQSELRAHPKHRFLRYLKLETRRGRPDRVTPPPPASGGKLATCTHIPFSSDMGRIMAAREQHIMSEDLKLKRLERTEWYTNKGVAKIDEVEYKAGSYKEPVHSHVYKPPKRQYHHKRRSLHNVDFLVRFCTPVSVVLERSDLDKVASDKKREVKQTRCSFKNVVGTVRTSSRLRNV